MNKSYSHFTPIALFVILLCVVGTGFQMKDKFERDIQTRDTTEAILWQELKDTKQRLQACERKIMAQRYAVCVILSKKYQYTPAIFASLQQFDGLTNYAFTYYPDSLICKCDTFSLRTIRKPKPITATDPPTKEDY